MSPLYQEQQEHMLKTEAKAKQKSGAAGTGTGYKKEQTNDAGTPGGFEEKKRK
jgi:hypothetical protein